MDPPWVLGAPACCRVWQVLTSLDRLRGRAGHNCPGILLPPTLAMKCSGPTVVLINGFGTTMAEWGPILPQLLAQASQVPTLVRLRIVFPADQIHEAAASALM